MNSLYDMISDKIPSKEMFRNVEILQSEKIKRNLILFGAGRHAEYVLRGLRDVGIEPSFFCDNNHQKHGSIFSDIEIISYEELLKNHRSSIIIITSLDYKKEIAEQLSKDGFFWIDNDVIYLMGIFGDDYEKAFNLFEEEMSKKVFYERILHCVSGDDKWLIPLKSSSEQYFEENIIKLTDNEIFIDGGAFVGDTVEEFLRKACGKFDKIYSFEPEESKHIEFNKIAANRSNIKLFPYGLWNTNTSLRFDARGTAGSMLSNDGNITINTVTIDSVLKGEPATFIKLDIQGAELEALMGAKETLIKHKPKLAICVYHKALDLVEIPIYLRSIVPEYKLYLRHYGDTVLETVLYAIKE